MVACWRYSPDDISIMGLHCRQTHYKPAIRGNTGDSATHSASTPWHETKPCGFCIAAIFAGDHHETYWNESQSLWVCCCDNDRSKLQSRNSKVGRKGRLCSDMEGYVGQMRIPAADGQRRFPGFPCRCRRYIYPALTRSLTGGKHLGSARQEVAPTAGLLTRDCRTDSGSIGGGRYALYRANGGSVLY